MAKKQKQKAKQAARKAGKGSALVKRQVVKQQPGGSGKRMLVPKHAKQGKAHKPVSSEKLALKARRREEQAARERAKAAEYAAERGQLPPPDVHIKPASFAVDAPPPRDEGDLRWLFAMDHERDAKRAARKARATAAPSKPAACPGVPSTSTLSDPPTCHTPSAPPTCPSVNTNPCIFGSSSQD